MNIIIFWYSLQLDFPRCAMFVYLVNSEYYNFLHFASPGAQQHAKRMQSLGQAWVSPTLCVSQLLYTKKWHFLLTCCLHCGDIHVYCLSTWCQSTCAVWAVFLQYMYLGRNIRREATTPYVVFWVLQHNQKFYLNRKVTGSCCYATHTVMYKLVMCSRNKIHSNCKHFGSL